MRMSNSHPAKRSSVSSNADGQLTSETHKPGNRTAKRGDAAGIREWVLHQGHSGAVHLYPGRKRTSGTTDRSLRWANNFNEKNQVVNQHWVASRTGAICHDGNEIT